MQNKSPIIIKINNSNFNELLKFPNNLSKNVLYG